MRASLPFPFSASCLHSIETELRIYFMTIEMLLVKILSRMASPASIPIQMVHMCFISQLHLFISILIEFEKFSYSSLPYVPSADRWEPHLIFASLVLFITCPGWFFSKKLSWHLLEPALIAGLVRSLARACSDFSGTVGLYEKELIIKIRQCFWCFRRDQSTIVIISAQAME